MAEKNKTEVLKKSSGDMSSKELLKNHIFFNMFLKNKKLPPKPQGENKKTGQRLRQKSKLVFS